jgi:hypothetical protein
MREGLRIGDRVTSRGPLVDAQGERVGSAYMDCVVMRRLTTGQGLYRCSYLLKLPDGDLDMQGLDPHGVSVSAFAVMGGTGAYRTARGDAVFTDSASGTEMVIDLVG